MPGLTKRGKYTRRLLAILANPSLDQYSRTARRVQAAGTLLGFPDITIANLFAEPSKSSRDIRLLGCDRHGWLKARDLISRELRSADAVLLGFGTIPVSGLAKAHLDDQKAWLRRQLELASHAYVWQVGNARHPSRWHQYLSDRHGRTSGGTFEERLVEQLRQVPISDALSA
ncbi:DUF1643 domain-containing protein [Microbacterium phycohabitans]|uniref:DUF1643 domain-containing protein n=1 Tax=Microbacterium phycohabitans TaxID=3075993 RepID=UPI0034607840